MNDQRVTFKSGGAGLMVVACVIPLLIGWAAIQFIQASLTTGAFWPVGVIAVLVLVAMVWLAITLLWTGFGPSMIITPAQIIQPRAFRNRVFDITPDRRFGQFTYRRGHRSGAVGEASISRSYTVTSVVTPKDDGSLAVLGTYKPESAGLTKLITTLQTTCGKSVETLAQDASYPTPRADVRHWAVHPD